MKKKTKNKIKVLVTGAAGFIGSHVVEALAGKDYEVVGLITEKDDPRWIKNLEASYVFGNIAEKSSLYKAVSGVKYIYHLAALLGDPNPENYYRINCDGTKNLVNVCLNSGTELQRFLFTSSITAMGPSGKNKLHEESPCNPINGYSCSKLLAEKFLESKKKELPITVVRLPLVYGPRSVGGLFPLFKMFNKGIRFNIRTTEINLGFVQDIVNGIILAAESPATLGKTYLLGEDKVYTSDEIFDTIEKVLGKKTIKFNLSLPALNFIAHILEIYAKINGQPALILRRNLNNYVKYRWHIDMSKAQREFGFKAEIPFETGAKITADWYKKEGFI
jgi:nucleoside-diphosphate-sugar epimerase